MCNRAPDRLSPIRQDAVVPVATLLEPLFHRRDDGQRILLAWVVGRDDRQIGQLTRHPSHQGTFAWIPIASAAEDEQDLVTQKGPYGFQRGLQSRVGMGVVDENRKGLAMLHRLQPNQ